MSGVETAGTQRAGTETGGTQTAGLAQRERALEAMTQLVSRDGYMDTTVAQITREAGLSRTSFYEHFSDKEACFLAAHEEIAERLGAEVTQAVGDGEPAQALATSIVALSAFATREPAQFQLVTHEALIAGTLLEGARPREARDRMIERIELAIEEAQRAAPDATELVDLPVRLVLGGTIRLLGLSMRRVGGAPEPSLGALSEWLSFYLVSPGQVRWQSLSSKISVAPAIDVSNGPDRSQPAQNGLPAQNLGAVQRERILHATADVVCAHGYLAMSVAEICSSAGVSRDVFYSHFKDKRDALLQTQRLVFEQLIAASAGAFFTVSTPWPERVWDAISAFITWIVEQPTLAHFEFIGGYASGPADAIKLDENILGFLIFLEEGDNYDPQTPEVPRVAREAIACAVVEVLGQYLRHYRSEEIPALLPLFAYVILAPFLGPGPANDFIDRQLLAAGR
jgi:AcrR family transcriptional regulator